MIQDVGILRLASQCITPKRDETEESISDGNAGSAAGAGGGANRAARRTPYGEDWARCFGVACAFCSHREAGRERVVSGGV